MDVKIAFLHGYLLEMIYMMQPEGFVTKGQEKKVCRLLKSLYGLKQSPRAWYHKFDTFMRSQGYKRSNADHCLYTKRASDGSLLLLILYVDDMLIAGRNVTELDALQQSLRTRFDMKDLGNANHILGMRISRDRPNRGLYLSQRDYLDKVLHRFHGRGEGN